MESDFDTRIFAQFQGLATTNTPQTAVTALGILMKLLRNISDSPEEAKFRNIKKSNKAISAKLLSCQGILEILLDIGYTEQDSDTLVYALDNDERLDIALTLIEVAIQEMQDSLKTDEEKAYEKRMYDLKMQAQAKERERKKLLDQAALDRKEASATMGPTQASHAVQRGPAKSFTYKDIGVDLNARRKG